METNLNNKSNLEEVFNIANLWIIFLARLIDIIITSMPSILFAIFVKVSNWETASYSMLIGIFSFLIFFVFLPMILNTKSIGKIICRIKLVRSEGKLLKMHLFLRELYFIGIPYIVLYTFQIIGMVILENTTNQSDNPMENGGVFMLLLQNSAHFFLLIWGIFILISIKLQEDHQSNIDMKFKIFAVSIDKDIEFDKEKKIEVHSHLGQIKPGEINLNELEKEINEGD